MPAQKDLIPVLLKMFTVDELRRIARWGSRGDELVTRLPSTNEAPLTYAQKLVEVLEGEGALDEFLQQARAERPRRVAELDRVMGPSTTREAAAPAPAPPVAVQAPAAARGGTAAPPLVDYVVATALAVEAQAVRSLLGEGEELTHENGTIVERLTFSRPKGDLHIGLVATGHGNEAAAAVLQGALMWLRPRAVAYVGVAGGVHREVRLGDVVVATKVYAFEYGKETDGGLLPRSEVRNTAHRFAQRAMAESTRDRWLRRLGGDVPQPQPRVWVKPMAAGSKVVAGQRTRTAESLRALYSDAYAVDMEGYGALLAADLTRTEAVVVRGISDLLEKDDASDDTWQPRAARNAAAFTLEMLANLEG